MPNLVNQFIKLTNISTDDIFLDMGSGIGNVVLQVFDKLRDDLILKIASQVQCESHGIEIMNHLHDLGIKQQNELETRMRFYGIKCGKIQLSCGDFLNDTESIKKADVIFINNFVFDSELQQDILQKLLDVKDSVQIITLKSLNLVDHKLSARNIHSIASIFNVKEVFSNYFILTRKHYFGSGYVSWMNEGGSFYIHTIDRRKLSDFDVDNRSN